MIRVATALVALLTVAGCNSTARPNAPSGGPATTCATIAADITGFGEVLETASANAKARSTTYAGRLELLLSFEEAATELEAELGAITSSDRAVSAKAADTRASLARSAAFARKERDSIEKHTRELAPLAREAVQSWAALRALCERRGPADCAVLREALAKFDAAESSEAHERALAELATVKLTTASLVKARDRAVKAGKNLKASSRAHADASADLPRRWGAIQSDLSTAIEALGAACKGEEPAGAPLVASEHPDPRKLTVLVHVKPPPAVEKSLLGLAKAASDADERALYEARAQGAFGSGFFLVRRTPAGSETLVVTNRHVVELGDRAALELADGTPLGAAEIVYSNPAHDIAVLRPSEKGAVREGFALAKVPARDQQTVIATGFPGLVGRPSYQTTRGYVSNESFRLDDGPRVLEYVQHTAPIDPGSSGGPLTDERGLVLGVNTLKVAGREGVGLAVPSRYVVDTLRTASLAEARHRSAAHRQKEARLACLGFLGELGAVEPRMMVLEQMISNQLVGVTGLEAAMALGSEEGFENLWNADSVRAMRIATLVHVRSAFMLGGGPSALETCDDVETSTGKPDLVKFRIRLANFEARELTLRWEHGRWKVDGFGGTKGGGAKPAAKKLPPPGPPPGSGPVAPKKVTPPRSGTK